jgi:spore germination protein
MTDNKQKVKNNQATKSQTNQNPGENSTQLVITPSQSTAIIASTLIGVGILTLPRTASETSHEMAWLATLIGGIIILPFMWFVTKLALRFPNKTIIDYASNIVGSERFPIIGKVISLPILLVFVLTWLALTTSAVRTFGNAITSAVLRETPIEVIIGTLLAATIFLVFVEVEVLARFNEVVFPLILIPLIIIVFLSLQNTEITNMFPLFEIDIMSFLNSLSTTIFAYTGFTIMLLFMAFAQKEKNVEANLTGIAIPGFIYTLIVFSSVAVFGYEELQHLMWPTLELIKTTDIPGMILERVESLFLAIWVAAVYTTVGNFYYAICFTVAQSLPIRNKDAARKCIAVLILPVLYWVSLQPRNIQQLFNWMDMIGYFSIVGFVIPIILYVIALIRKKGKEPSPIHEKQR